MPVNQQNNTPAVAKVNTDRGTNTPKSPNATTTAKRENIEGEGKNEVSKVAMEEKGGVEEGERWLELDCVTEGFKQVHGAKASTSTRRKHAAIHSASTQQYTVQVHYTVRACTHKQ